MKASAHSLSDSSNITIADYWRAHAVATRMAERVVELVPLSISNRGFLTEAIDIAKAQCSLGSLIDRDRDTSIYAEGHQALEWSRPLELKYTAARWALANIGRAAALAAYGVAIFDAQIATEMIHDSFSAARLITSKHSEQQLLKELERDRALLQNPDASPSLLLCETLWHFQRPLDWQPPKLDGPTE